MQPIDRRRFLATAGTTVAAAAVLSPEHAFAATGSAGRFAATGSAGRFAVTGSAGWQLGFADVEADIAPTPMRLVAGRAPARLAGTLYRNGPAKFRRGTTASGHWFDGDGLVRKYTLDGGEVAMAARFVDTPKRRVEAAAGAMIVPGFGTRARGASLASADDASSANTSVMMAGDELWALWEAGSPVRLDPATLATRGFTTLGDGLAHMPFLAHPRVEPDGTVWNLGQAGDKAILYRLDARGGLQATHPIDLPRASYLHDFTATARHIVIVLQPWVRTRDTFPIVDALAWRPQLGTQVVVLDKADPSRRRLFDLPAFSFFHLGDAWEERDGTIRFDGCIARDPDFAIHGAGGLLEGRIERTSLPVLAMIALHPDGRGELAPTRVTAEFPRSDARRAGVARRYAVHTGLYGRGPTARGLGVFDWSTGRERSFDFGADHLVEEFLFVAAGDGELDGYLVGTTLNLAARATELHAFRAHDVAAGPLATWRAEVALPVGFHGTFVG